MSTAVLESNLLTADNVLSGAFSIPLPQVEQGLSLCFDIPAFQLQLTIPITEIESDMIAGRVMFRAKLEADVVLALTGTGTFNSEADNFKIEQVDLQMEQLTETARADFIISTIRAALILAGDVYVRIPSIQLDVTLRFDEPLLDSSQMLRRRQIEYRVMVIERTVGYEFHLPSDISGDEVRDITLAYYAIVDRSFVWPFDSIKIFFPATRESADMLARLRQETSIPIGPDPFSLKLFGRQIELGQRGIIIQDAVIENLELVQNEISKNDGHMVPVLIRSTSGHAKYDFFAVPKPPAVMWDANVQKLVELEPQLDAVLVARYHALAAATLAGLTEEEKTELTARPKIGEAFLIDNSDGE